MAAIDIRRFYLAGPAALAMAFAVALHAEPDTAGTEGLPAISYDQIVRCAFIELSAFDRATERFKTTGEASHQTAGKQAIARFKKLIDRGTVLNPQGERVVIADMSTAGTKFADEFEASEGRQELLRQATADCDALADRLSESGAATQ